MLSFTNRLLKRAIGREILNNEMYGHAGVLRRYCRLRIPLPIQGFVQHGWSYGPGIPLGDLKAGSFPGVSRFFLWNPRNKQFCHSHGFHSVRIIGAPLLYLRPPQKAPTEAEKSLLLFPGHTSYLETFAEDGAGLFSRYLDELRPVISSFQSTTMCLYWREFEDSRIRKLVQERGLAVTTLGHRDQTPDFVARFRDLVLCHEYVSTNEYSTSLFYSLFLGRKAFVHGQTFVNRLQPEKIDSLTQFGVMSHLYPQLKWEKFDDTSYQHIGAEEIGASFKLGPNELRAELGWTASRQLKSISRRLARFLQRKFRRPSRRP